MRTAALVHSWPVVSVLTRCCATFSTLYCPHVCGQPVQRMSHCAGLVNHFLQLTSQCVLAWQVVLQPYTLCGLAGCTLAV
jgi:hypothetical protein